MYINTSGVSANPPKFIELMEGKTINFELDEYSIHIAQVSFNKGMAIIEKIVFLFELLSEQMKVKAETRTEEIKNNLFKMKTYNALVGQIYNLSKHYVKSKAKFKKKLHKKANADFAWLLSICSEIIDYWTFVGKQLALLSKGKTIRQTFGADATWNSLSWDSSGAIEIKPRYVLSMN